MKRSGCPFIASAQWQAATVQCLSEYRRLRGAEKIILSVAATVSLGLISGACAVSKEPTPYQACGQDLGPPSGFTLQHLHDGLPIYSGYTVLVLVSGCTHGAEVTITPPTIARIVDAIRAADGGYKAIALSGNLPGEFGYTGAQGTLTVTQGQKIIGKVAIGVSSGAATPPPGAP